MHCRYMSISRSYSQVEILKQLKEYELFTMADAMQEMLYEEGDVICRQGDAGRNFFPADLRKAIGRFKLLYNKARFGGLHPSGCSG